VSEQKGGFFAKRFGIVKQRDYSSKQRREAEESAAESHPLDLKTLKVPAVFRLLRPEFREQLKLNSCQVGIPLDQSAAPPKKERIIPIVRESAEENGLVVKNGDTRVTPEKAVVTAIASERLIPIVVQKQNGESLRDASGASPLKTVMARAPRSPVKPALPAKPMSPTRPARVTPPSASLTPAADTAEKKAAPEEERVITVTVEKLEDPSIPEKVVIEEVVTPDESVVASQPDVAQKPEDEVEERDDVVVERHNGEDAAHHGRGRFEDTEEDPFSGERYLRSSTSPPCGLRERTLLCPIQVRCCQGDQMGRVFAQWVVVYFGRKFQK
jgi:hypothetical protein